MRRGLGCLAVAAECHAKASRDGRDALNRHGDEKRERNQDP
jgi:hypothetical protein